MKKITRVYSSSKFNTGYKLLVKKHKKKEIKTLNEVINKLINFESVQQYKPHPMNGHPNILELHISGNVLLLYSIEGDLLSVDLYLQDLTDHDTLDRQLKTSKKQVYKVYNNPESANDILNEDDDISNLENYI